MKGLGTIKALYDSLQSSRRIDPAPGGGREISWGEDDKTLSAIPVFRDVLSRWQVQYGASVRAFRDPSQEGVASLAPTATASRALTRERLLPRWRVLL